MKLYVIERKSERGRWGVRVGGALDTVTVQFVFLTRQDAEEWCCTGDRVVVYEPARRKMVPKCGFSACDFCDKKPARRRKGAKKP